jgi:N utilization substance protein B
MGLRRVARECALQMLYQYDVGKIDEEEILVSFWLMNEQPEKVQAFANSLVRGSIAEIEEIDRKIQEHAQNWRLARMAAVDRNILRLAVYELLSVGDTPATVVINEALEIAKKYSTPDSAHFVNGILDSLQKKEMKEGRA